MYEYYISFKEINLLFTVVYVVWHTPRKGLVGDGNKSSSQYTMAAQGDRFDLWPLTG